MMKFKMKRELVFILAMALPVSALAQDNQGSASPEIIRKSRAPVSSEILQVKVPKAVKAILENGLTVLILEDHRQPIVSVQLNIRSAGALYEPPALIGLASVTAQLLRAGTSTRTKREILQEVALLGATLSSSSRFGSSAASINASGLVRNMDDWLAVMLDVLVDPQFPEAELRQFRERLKAQLQQQRTTAGFLARERFQKALFGKHPASIVSPTEESLDRLTRESIRAWHGNRYAPQSSILSVAGDVYAKDLIPKLSRLFSVWERTDLVVKLPTDPVPAVEKRVFLVDRPNSSQTTIFIGNIVLDRRHQDYIPLTVMNEVLGGGAASRLFIKLREEKGYTYGAYSNFSALEYPGAWRAFADVRTGVTDGAMSDFMSEIRRIGELEVPKRELDAVKRSIVARFALSLEQASGLLRYSTIREIYGFSEDYWDKYPGKIMSVTSQDVQRVASKYLSPNALQIVTVGDALRIKQVMEKYGPIQIYDTRGKRLLDH